MCSWERNSWVMAELKLYFILCIRLGWNAKESMTGHLWDICLRDTGLLLPLKDGNNARIQGFNAYFASFCAILSLTLSLSFFLSLFLVVCIFYFSLSLLPSAAVIFSSALGQYKNKIKQIDFRHKGCSWMPSVCVWGVKQKTREKAKHSSCN